MYLTRWIYLSEAAVQYMLLLVVWCISGEHWLRVPIPFNLSHSSSARPWYKRVRRLTCHKVTFVARGHAKRVPFNTEIFGKRILAFSRNGWEKFKQRSPCSFWFSFCPQLYPHVGNIVLKFIWSDWSIIHKNLSRLSDITAMSDLRSGV